MEFTWKQFREKQEIKDLPLNEQVRRYHFYLDALSNELHRQNKGAQAPAVIEPYSGFILQEDYNYLLQEDGFRIYL